MYKETVVRSAQILGLQVAGVDMLEGAKGPLIKELVSEELGDVATELGDVD